MPFFAGKWCHIFPFCMKSDMSADYLTLLKPWWKWRPDAILDLSTFWLKSRATWFCRISFGVSFKIRLFTRLSKLLLGGSRSLNQMIQRFSIAESYINKTSHYVVHHSYGSSLCPFRLVSLFYFYEIYSCVSMECWKRSQFYVCTGDVNKVRTRICFSWIQNCLCVFIHTILPQPSVCPPASRSIMNQLDNSWNKYLYFHWRPLWV